MPLAPGGKRHQLAQNSHKLRSKQEPGRLNPPASDGKTKQKTWQGKNRQEAAHRVQNQLRSKLGEK